MNRPACKCGHPADYHINFVGEGKPKPPGPPNYPRKDNFCRHPTRTGFCSCRNYASALELVVDSRSFFPKEVVPILESSHRNRRCAEMSDTKKFLTDEERKYLIKRKGWTEEMVRDYQRSGQIEGDKVLTDMIEELKPFGTLESGVKFRDRRRTSQ